MNNQEAVKKERNNPFSSVRNCPKSDGILPYLKINPITKEVNFMKGKRWDIMCLYL
jgi:hypothetical protein